MTIQIARQTDLPHIRRYDCHIPEEQLISAIRDERIFTLKQDDQVCGILRWSLFWGSIPFLDLLYLDETVRSQGYGRRMMAMWEAHVAVQGHRVVMLSTQADETVKYFYEKLGYYPIGAFLPKGQEAEELMYEKCLGDMA